MTAEIINLRRARKERARAADKDQAAVNRVAFGRTKADKTVAKSEKDAAEKRLDGHRRDD